MLTQSPRSMRTAANFSSRQWRRALAAFSFSGVMLRPFVSSAPPRRGPISHAGVARAVGEARGRGVAAKPKIRGTGIADRPAALAPRQLEQRATLRAVDWYGLTGNSVGGACRVGVQQAQELALRRKRRAPDAWRASPRRRSLRTPRPQAKAMDFADDGVPRDADFGGNLTAGQARDDKVSKLLDALRIPGCSGHATAS